MNIEEQVLSIAQVRELQELGFNIEKYASMAWVEQTPFIPIEQPKKYELEILTNSLIGNRGELDLIPTLTALDIIDILPEVLDRPRIIHRNYYLFITKLAVSYSNRDRYDHEFIRYIETKNPNFHPFENKEGFIICLFEALKWCIKEKHIAL